MAITAKCTWFFSDGAYGWSESLWLGAVDLPTALTKAVDMAAIRLPLCGAGPQINYIRVSDEAVYRDSLVAAVNFVTVKEDLVDNVLVIPSKDAGIVPRFIPPALAPVGGAPPNASDRPYSAILIRMQSGNLYRRLMYLRGAPDIIITDPIGPSPTKAWVTAFTKWSKAITDGGWSFKVISKPGVGNPLRVILSITPQAGGALAKIGIPLHGLSQLDRVRVFGCKGKGPLPKGLYSVQLQDPPDTNVVSFVEYAPPNVPPGNPTYLGGGNAIKQAYSYVPIDLVQVRGQTTRRTGRPFDSPRGRRRVKKPAAQ